MQECMTWNHIQPAYELSNALGLDFIRFYSIILFCSPLHVHFSTIKHFLLGLVLMKQLLKFSSIFALKRKTFKLQWNE